MPSGGELATNIDVLAALGKWIRVSGGLHFTAGDWNCAASSIVASRWPSQAKLGLIEMKGVAFTCATAPARVLDYAFASHALRKLALFTHTSQDAPWRPHCAVCFSLAKRPATTMTRVRLAPRPLPVPDEQVGGTEQSQKPKSLTP